MQDKMKPGFAILPWEVAADHRLTKSDLRVLIALLSFRSVTTAPFWATREQIAGHCRMRVPHITRSTTHLEALGWVRKHHLKRQTTRYEFIVPIEATVREDGGKTIIRDLEGRKIS